MAEDQETPKKTKWLPPVPTKEQVEALDIENDDVLHLDGGEMAPWHIVVRRPTRNETLVYKAAARREGQSATANEGLIKKIAVFPDADAMKRICEKWALAPDGIVDSAKFKEFVGISAQADLKD